MNRSLAAIGAALVLSASATNAQLLQKKTLSLEAARKVIAAAVVEARKDIGTGVIAVVDDGGNLMAVERLDNTFPAGANISIGKARTAAIFKRPSRFFEEVIAKGRTSMTALTDFTPLQGGVPILDGDQVVGAVGVSGAASAQRDEEIAMAGAAAIGGTMTPTMGMSAPAGRESVEYIENSKVAAAFAKGMPLLEIGNYKIHASRREAPGMAEIHQKDADIIYVLDGTATLVTGGTAVDAKMTAQDELRGSSIQGGDSRTLNKGDVIVVPKGVPHWFKEVHAPFLYYVVKVS